MTQRVPPSGEARLRQFLAAERLAERMGLRTRELRSVPELESAANAPTAHSASPATRTQPSGIVALVEDLFTIRRKLNVIEACSIVGIGQR